ncbi:sensor histidine kinase [Streptomyces lasiicapitis]|uniref:sensor histidine kinase n=1 Tax=Streptomyces lasiicapitis TaxID=1923961 RepID=UPI0036882163
MHAPSRPPRIKGLHLRPQPQDVVVAVGALVIEVTGYALSIEPGGTSWSLGVLALHLLPAAPLLWHRRFPVTVLIAVLAAQAVLTPLTSVPYGLPISLVIALYSVARLRSTRVTGAAAVVALVGLQVPGLSEHEELARAIFADVVGVCIALAVGCAARRWQRQDAEHRRLLADHAVAAERRRIARELHDVVAHHITAMQLMAGGARRVLHHDADMAQDALKSLEDSGRLALAEMRQLLDVLRADDDTEGGPTAPQPGVADLPQVVADSCRAGVATELLVEGEPELNGRELAPTLGLTVFRIVQEALTNVRKHAGGAQATVRLDYAPGLLTVEIRNDASGTGGTARKGGPGHGLVGMRERVTLHGGTLEAGAGPAGGFRILATLPLPADAPPPLPHTPAPQEKAATR